jgi:hypothetical protein
MTYMITNIMGIVNQQIPDQTPSKAGRPSSLNPVMIFAMENPGHADASNKGHPIPLQEIPLRSPA